jgi:putative SOS response-associated peptidase YedK
MCGRYAITLPKEAMTGLFDLDDAPELKPRWNVAPSQPIPVIAIGQDGARKAFIMRWGMHPSWMKEPPGAKSMINARSETAAEKPFFRDAFKKRRCLIPVDGFYEWKRDGAVKQPYYIHRGDNAPLAFAGLWDRWGKGDETVLNAAILTTGANPFMAALHDRMPCILGADTWSQWLDPGALAQALGSLLRPLEGDALVAHPVSRAINSSAQEGPQLIAPHIGD